MVAKPQAGSVDFSPHRGGRSKQRMAHSDVRAA